MSRKGAKARQKSRDESVQAPQPFFDIIENVCDQDRMHFKDNPDHSVFWRRCVPGETWPFFPLRETWVEVRHILPGLTMRIFHQIENGEKRDDPAWLKPCSTDKRILILDDEDEDSIEEA